MSIAPCAPAIEPLWACTRDRAPACTHTASKNAGARLVAIDPAVACRAIQYQKLWVHLLWREHNDLSMHLHFSFGGLDINCVPRFLRLGAARCSFGADSLPKDSVAHGWARHALQIPVASINFVGLVRHCLARRHAAVQLTLHTVLCMRPRVLM